MTTSNTVISVSRKPLASSTVAANVLDHGTGALNINATRIRSGSAEPDSGAMFYKNRGLPMPENRTNYFQGEDQKYTGTPIDGGRWPANLILGHKPECVHLGAKVVDSTSGVVAEHHRRNVPMGYMTGDMRGVKPTCYVNPDGTEVVESWECVVGCAVAELDRQSGESKSSGGRIGNKDGGLIYGGGKGLVGAYESGDPGYGDTGGASRYFKQVGDFNVSTDIPNDLLQYLTTLITPTHVGGETLIALDIEAVDWTSIPDGRYHGLIARGEPTAEQTEHMWRVVKPGAHVLLIAPDECPTGHHGACALEDQGFEIRDAILWVREAGGLHYVPKTNSRERNAGCEALAAKRKGAPIYELTESTLEDEALVASIVEALQEAGVAGEVVDALMEGGLPKNLVPAEYKRAFQKRVGAGKYGNNHPCLPIGEQVLTIHGFRSIHEVQVGDRVLSADGRFHAVEHVSNHPFTEGVVYEISVTGIGMQTRATGNHPFLIWRATRDAKGNLQSGNVQWVDASTLRKGDYTLTPILKDDAAPAEVLPSICEKDGFWFLFGLFLAEGSFQMAGHGSNFYTVFSLHEDETHLVDKVRSFVEPARTVSVYTSPEHRGIHVFAFDPELSEAFLLLGGRYSDGKRLHPSVWGAPIEAHRALLEGYLEGDGCDVRRYRQAKTVSADMAAQLVMLAERLGYKTNHHTYTGKPTTIRGRLMKSRKPEHQLAFYSVNNEEGRSRKPSRPTTVEYEGTVFALRHVKKVVRAPYEGDVWNLSVEGSPTFQTAVGMSHNTVKPKEIMARLLRDVPTGAVVMDPFLGSGSTGLACLETGHDFIGIEREPDYLEIADARARYWQGSVKGWLDTHIDSEAPPVVKTDAVDERGVFDLFD